MKKYLAEYLELSQRDWNGQTTTVKQLMSIQELPPGAVVLTREEVEGLLNQSACCCWDRGPLDRLFGDSL